MPFFHLSGKVMRFALNVWTGRKYGRKLLETACRISLSPDTCVTRTDDLLHRYGPQARAIIEERLGLWVTIGAVILVIGIAAALYLF